MTSGEGAGPAEQVVAIANASDTDAVGTVTLFPEGAAPKAVPVQVPAHSRFELKVSDQVTAPWAAALVETTGGEVAVGHDLSGPSGHSVSDCASTPSAEWYFPAGLSRVGSDIYLALFNPFPGEATVDLSFDTDNGIRSSPKYQGIVVPGGSVVVEKVSEVVTETDRVATNVSVRSGRIVAEQIQTLDGREGRPKGLTATVGASTPAAVWSFPMSAPADVDAAESVAVFNPGDTDTDVLVQVQLDDPVGQRHGRAVRGHHPGPPGHHRRRAHPRDQRVPPGVPHWVIVRTTDGSDIVAERTLTGGPSGVSYTIGLPVVATRWIATIAGNGQPTSQLSIANPSATETATVTVRGISGGRRRHRRRRRPPGGPGGAGRRRPHPGRPRRRVPRSRSSPTSAWSSVSGWPSPARPTSPPLSACRSAAPSRCRSRSSTPPSPPATIWAVTWPRPRRCPCPTPRLR